MDSLRQAQSYLERDPLRYMDMLEPIRRGMVEVTALREDGVLLYNLPGELYMLAADSVESAQALCAGVGEMELAVAHSRETGEYLQKRYGIARCQGCTQAAYLGKEPFPAAQDVEIRPLGPVAFSVVCANYHAFAGRTDLEVLPPYRRRGVALALMSAMANHCLERGWVPFSQIFDGNTASLELHRRLGWTLCPEKLYWVMD